MRTHSARMPSVGHVSKKDAWRTLGVEPTEENAKVMKVAGRASSAGSCAHGNRAAAGPAAPQ